MARSKYGEPMKYYTFMVPLGLLVLVKAAAESEGVTLSELLRGLMFSYLEKFSEGRKEDEIQ